MKTNSNESKSSTIRSELRSLKNPEKAKILSGFFKTGPGEYGEGDRFLGIAVPDIRRIVKTHRHVSLKEIMELLHSGYHEERLAALLFMVARYQRGDAALKKEIFDLYLNNTAYINSWDLVDLTAPHIVGEQLARKGRSLLMKLAQSEILWERRIAILASFYFIRKGESRITLNIAKVLLHDSQDLIHKAVGWMLREVGKRCSIEAECVFLDRYAAFMPRTMLRYAIERFPKDLKEHYMKK
ncbi:MAG: DNA alkylation repair protein [Acidobacteria bacterium]|nr:DNA alkylation repair protein [Acidobacteriota bacterium]